MQTEVSYRYCDGSNYKYHGTFILDGEFEPSQIESYLFDGEFFVPHEVGLDHLLTDSMNETDHYLHEIIGVTSVSERNAICTADEFVQRFHDASSRGWFSSICL